MFYREAGRAKTQRDRRSGPSQPPSIRGSVRDCRPWVARLSSEAGAGPRPLSAALLHPLAALPSAVLPSAVLPLVVLPLVVLPVAASRLRGKVRVRIRRGRKAFAIPPGPKPPTQPSTQPAPTGSLDTQLVEPPSPSWPEEEPVQPRAPLYGLLGCRACNPCPCAPWPCRKLLVTLWMLAVRGGVESGT